MRTSLEGNVLHARKEIMTTQDSNLAAAISLSRPVARFQTGDGVGSQVQATEKTPTGNQICCAREIRSCRPHRLGCQAVW